MVHIRLVSPAEIEAQLCLVHLPCDIEMVPGAWYMRVVCYIIMLFVWFGLSSTYLQTWVMQDEGQEAWDEESPLSVGYK
jgi:hypothetical protein